MTNRILLLLHPDLEELEAVGPADLLRRAGLDVCMASTTNRLLVTGRNQMTLQADALLDDINPDHFDAIIVPGGPGVAALREDGRTASLLKAFSDTGRPVAAICAAPLLLKDGGLLGDADSPAAHFTCREELPMLDCESNFVDGGGIYTSRSAGDAIAFGLGLAARLAGRDKAIEVAETICLSATDVP